VVELQSGQVTLAALPSLAATVVPAACARFSARHPGIQFRIVDTLSGPAFDLVPAGQVDFALTAANPAYADLDYLPLASDGFVLLIPPGHALAQANGPLRWIDVAALTHISMPLPACGLGVAALPELAAAVAPQPGVVRRLLVEPDISRPIGLVTRRYRSLSPAATALVDMLREEMARVAPRPRLPSKKTQTVNTPVRQVFEDKG